MRPEFRLWPFTINFTMGSLGPLSFLVRFFLLSSFLIMSNISIRSTLARLDAHHRPFGFGLISFLPGNSFEFSVDGAHCLRCVARFTIFDRFSLIYAFILRSRLCYGQQIVLFIRNCSNEITSLPNSMK